MKTHIQLLALAAAIQALAIQEPASTQQRPTPAQQQPAVTQQQPVPIQQQPGTHNPPNPVNPPTPLFDTGPPITYEQLLRALGSLAYSIGDMFKSLANTVAGKPSWRWRQAMMFIHPGVWQAAMKLKDPLAAAGVKATCTNNDFAESNKKE